MWLYDTDKQFPFCASQRCCFREVFYHCQERAECIIGLKLPISMLVSLLLSLLVLIWSQSSKLHDCDDMFMPSRFIRWMDCPCCPVTNKSRISSFIVKSFKESCSNGLRVLRYLSTVATSQIVLYLGCVFRVTYNLYPLRTG